MLQELGDPLGRFLDMLTFIVVSKYNTEFPQLLVIDLTASLFHSAYLNLDPNFGLLLVYSFGLHLAQLAFNFEMLLANQHLSDALLKEL